MKRMFDKYKSLLEILKRVQGDGGECFRHPELGSGSLTSDVARAYKRSRSVPELSAGAAKRRASTRGTLRARNKNKFGMTDRTFGMTHARNA